MTSTPHKPGPHVLAVIDLEGSGLRLTGPGQSMLTFEREPHKPGVDHDCILEVGLIMLAVSDDPRTASSPDRDCEYAPVPGSLREVHRQSWLVLPPGVDTIEKFDVWEGCLKEANPFVYEMHSKPSMVRDRGESLLSELRALAGSANKPASGSIAWVEGEVLKVVREWSGLPDQHKDAWRAEHLGVPGTGPHLDWSTVHPGNSDIMFTGNSIANYDIPMLKQWMPALHRSLSYRIMDVSVLRTFYQDLAGVELPEGLAEDIRSGGGGHRALADADFCATSLRVLMDYARTSATLYGVAASSRASYTGEVQSEDQGRIAHLEMLVRYGSRRAIKEERKNIEARDDHQRAWTASPTNGLEEAGQGLFRKAGGILHAKPSDFTDGDDTSNDGMSAFWNGR